MHAILQLPRPATPQEPDPQTRDFYLDAMRVLDDAAIPYTIGGGYAMAYYTGIARNTKDLDLFIKPSDRDRTLSTLSAAGYKTEFFYEFWIAKALHGEAFIDLLYSSGNGICVVDDEWFANATAADVFGYPTRLVPAEEQLWSKAFVQDRDRFDGADVIHLLYARGPLLDWERLLRRFDGHERVLLAHLILYGYVYPCQQDRKRIPQFVMDTLLDKVRHEPVTRRKLCRGPNIAQRGYGTALSEWGYLDARVAPEGPLTPEQIAQLPPP
jgi:PAS domain-containing protein